MTTKGMWSYYFSEAIFPSQKIAYELLPKTFCKPGKHSWIKIAYTVNKYIGAEVCGKCKLYRRPKKTSKKTTKKKIKTAPKDEGSELVKTAKYFWAWGRANLSFKMIVIGTIAFILLIELIRGLIF